MSTAARRAELAANLAALEERIAAACAAAGRPRAEAQLIAVSKTFPASDVRLLADLGVTDIGENRDQEAAPKAAACADLPLTWHFVGQLQTNKCRSVARYASYVHSVDRPRLVSALGQAADRVGRTVGCLVEVRLDQRENRAGVPPAEVPALAETIAGTAGLTLAGVMGIAPLDTPPDEPLGVLAGAARALRAEHPEAVMLSAGMSGDLEAAINYGATHVRIGTALLGMRPTSR